MPRVDTDAFYRNALKRYGHNAQDAHWESARSHRVRCAGYCQRICRP